MADLNLEHLKNRLNFDLLEIYNNGPVSLVDPINYVLSGKGKRIRPILTFLSANACGGSAEDAMPVALAVEILHNFTLVHDDIMDDDNTRHGKPTVHQKWDNGTAILTGDAMLSLALMTLQKCPRNNAEILKVFTNGLLAVCEGQAIDKEFETKTDVTVEEYVHMIDLKTGYLIGMAAELGALSITENSNYSSALCEYGKLVGRAFQIQDDLLELYSDAKQMGKSLDSDYLLGKKTYPMLRIKENHADELNTALKVAGDNVDLGKELIRSILENSGIKSEIELFITQMINDANQLLTENDLLTEHLESFSALIHNRKK